MNIDKTAQVEKRTEGKSLFLISLGSMNLLCFAHIAQRLFVKSFFLTVLLIGSINAEIYISDSSILEIG